MSCPCGSGRDYQTCCEPYHAGKDHAPNPEALMRARYCAFVKGEVDYVVSTHHPKDRDEVDVEGARAWSSQSEWLGLDVLEASGDVVEFVARYRQQGAELRHHERSRFAQVDGRWYYVDGDIVRQAPVRAAARVGRNEPCPCGSGKKYKKCCG